jgi:hypothetical protein
MVKIIERRGANKNQDEAKKNQCRKPNSILKKREGYSDRNAQAT